MTVFVVHAIRQEDITPANKWGAFRFINGGYVYGDELWPVLTAAVDSAPQWTIPPSYFSNMNKAAKDYDPERDYVLIGGDHLQLVALIGLIASYHSTLQVLRYDKKISDYIPVRIQLPDMRGLDVPTAPVVGSTTDIGETPSGQDSDEGTTVPLDSAEAQGFLEGEQWTTEEAQRYGRRKAE